MFDAQTTALLHAVIDDVCQTVSRYEIGTRTHVAAKILEAARQSEARADSLMQVGRKAQRRAEDAAVMSHDRRSSLVMGERPFRRRPSGEVRLRSVSEPA